MKICAGGKSRVKKESKKRLFSWRKFTKMSWKCNSALKVYVYTYICCLFAWTEMNQVCLSNPKKLPSATLPPCFSLFWHVFDFLRSGVRFFANSPGRKSDQAWSIVPCKRLKMSYLFCKSFVRPRNVNNVIQQRKNEIWKNLLENDVKKIACFLLKKEYLYQLIFIFWKYIFMLI